MKVMSPIDKLLILSGILRMETPEEMDAALKQFHKDLSWEDYCQRKAAARKPWKPSRELRMLSDAAQELATRWRQFEDNPRLGSPALRRSLWRQYREAERAHRIQYLTETRESGHIE